MDIDVPVIVNAINATFHLTHLARHFARHSETPVDIGLVWFCSGVLYAGHTWYLHIRRMHVLKHGDRKHCFSWQWSSIWWMSTLGFLLTAGFAIELYYAVKYPYFYRSKQVEIVGTPTPSPTSA